MIEITRSLARQLKALFRRAISESGRGSVHDPVRLSAGPTGLQIGIASRYVAAEFHDPAPCTTDAMVVPFQLLADCEGRHDEPVRLELTASQEVLATWSDSHVPQMTRYPVPEMAPEFSLLPTAWAENPSELAVALHEAMQTAAPESTRFALHCVQLRGTGTLAATDGHELFVQTGFQFPWVEDLLIPTRSLFDSKELPADQPIFIGRTDKSVCFRSGSWTFVFAIETEARFPKFDETIRPHHEAIATAELSPADAEFLRRTLASLPNDDEFHHAVTLDLNGSVAIRARASVQSHPVELHLTNSTPRGQSIRINTNRQYLDRALRLGFRELHIFQAETPIQCQDERRTYVWGVLSAEDAVLPTPDTVRIESSPVEANLPAPTPTIRKGTPVTTTSKAKDLPDQTATPDQTIREVGVEGLIDQAEQLRVSLREALNQTGAFVTSLKRHRKEAKLVRSTLDSLRQLQQVG